MCQPPGACRQRILGLILLPASPRSWGNKTLEPAGQMPLLSCLLRFTAWTWPLSREFSAPVHGTGCLPWASRLFGPRCALWFPGPSSATATVGGAGAPTSPRPTQPVYASPIFLRSHSSRVASSPDATGTVSTDGRQWCAIALLFAVLLLVLVLFLVL